MATNWDTTRGEDDNIKINDGVVSYFTDSSDDLESIARDFFSTYDFNLDDDDGYSEFTASIENLDTDESASFTCDSQGNFEWN